MTCNFWYRNLLCSTTLESGIDVGQGINVGHEQNVQSCVTKKPSNLKISVGHGKNSKM